VGAGAAGRGVGGGGRGGCACGSDFFDSPDPEAARLVLKLRARERPAARRGCCWCYLLLTTYWLLAAGTASQEPGGKKEEAIADRCELAAGCWSDPATSMAALGAGGVLGATGETTGTRRPGRDCWLGAVSGG
jgi:hypothetical protein